MVYVLNKDGQPLMPTERYGKVRRLLKSEQAVVIKRCPFTIKLLNETTSHTQEISLGIDAGSKHIGLSATTRNKVLYESDVALRIEIIELLSKKRELRRSRRNRKTRYRKPRFDNRTHSKHKGWLAPSIEQRIQTHLTVTDRVHKMLPVSKIKVEVASFDMQKIQNPEIEGTEYQQGRQLGFWNIREYVLSRDGHVCQCCKGKSKDKILNVHHIESRKTGGDSPDNLITLCEYCHKQYHLGKIKLPSSIKRRQSLRDAAFMGIMRWTFYNRLKEMYPNVNHTYGYITKNTRIENKLLPKDKDTDDKHYPLNHVIDARCISGNPLSVSDGTVHYQKKVRCHNRQIHKCSISKGGIRKLNQCPYVVEGYHLFDKVLYKKSEGFIYGRRRDGRFAVRTLGGIKLNEQISYKKLKLIESAKRYITERRKLLLIGASPDVPAA